MGGKERLDLGLDRLHQHPPGAIPQHGQQRVVGDARSWSRQGNNAILVHGVSSRVTSTITEDTPPPTPATKFGYSSVYDLVRWYTERRLQRWLTRRSGRQGTGYRRYPKSYLYQALGLYELPRAYVDPPSAKARELEREPDAGNPHVRFDERRLETEPCRAGLRGRSESDAVTPPGG